jgi:uncharacterized repeat protein (TIGR03803 family)
MKKIITLLILLLFNLKVAKAQLTTILTLNGTNGYHPYGSLITDGSCLYGMTSGGGANSMGTIFKINPNGTGYTDLLDFSGTTNGNHPCGSLIYDGTYLYGTTNNGGTSNMGVVFKIKTDGTGYLKLLDFNGANGSYSAGGSLYYDGTFLYGMTSAGGASGSSCGGYGCGTIFKIMPSGTGYTKLFDFNGTNGEATIGSLISDGTYLYGMTQSGGANNDGTIFKIKTDGTGYINLLDFNGANGNHPWGDLFYDGTFLYGLTSLGGTNSDGVIFKIKTDGSGYLKLFDFSGFPTDGANPYGSLIYDGTYLYGMTKQGGVTHDEGTIFKIMPNGTGFINVSDFNDPSTGANPQGSLFSDGTNMYGMTSDGGANNDGTIFKISLLTGIKQTISSNEAINIYPNPTQNNFVIETNSTDKQTLQVFDVNGKLVLTQTINGKTNIDAGNLPEGVYNLSLQNANGVLNKRLVIVR